MERKARTKRARLTTRERARLTPKAGVKPSSREDRRVPVLSEPASAEPTVEETNVPVLSETADATESTDNASSSRKPLPGAAELGEQVEKLANDDLGEDLSDNLSDDLSDDLSGDQGDFPEEHEATHDTHADDSLDTDSHQDETTTPAVATAVQSDMNSEPESQDGASDDASDPANESATENETMTAETSEEDAKRAAALAKSKGTEHLSVAAVTATTAVNSGAVLAAQQADEADTSHEPESAEAQPDNAFEAEADTAPTESTDTTARPDDGVAASDTTAAPVVRKPKTTDASERERRGGFPYQRYPRAQRLGVYLTAPEFFFWEIVATLLLGYAIQSSPGAVALLDSTALVTMPIWAQFGILAVIAFAWHGFYREVIGRLFDATISLFAYTGRVHDTALNHATATRDMLTIDAIRELPRFRGNRWVMLVIEIAVIGALVAAALLLSDITKSSSMWTAFTNFHLAWQVGIGAALLLAFHVFIWNDILGPIIDMVLFRHKGPKYLSPEAI